MDGDVAGAAGRDRKIECFCEPRDLHEGRDAAAIGDVGLGIRHRAGRDIVLQLPERERRFSPAAIGTPPPAMMRTPLRKRL